MPIPAPPSMKAPYHWPSVALTCAIGMVGAFLARALHLPLPMLLGSLIAVAGISLTRWKPLGHAMQVPLKWRGFVIPVIGVAIGANFTPEIVDAVAQWWPSLLVLALFIPIIHLLGYASVMATGRTDKVTAFFGTAPGGLIESVQMGEERGGDPVILTMMQFLRLIITVVSVPIFFTVMTGHAVGSGGGVTLDTVPLRWQDWPILIVVGVLGWILGRRLNLPAGMITGPIVLSGIAHLLGLVQGAPPAYLVSATQLVIGISLGTRFNGMPLSRIGLALRLSGVSTALSIGTATACAYVLGPLIDEPRAAVFLAFAPGGLIEMSLIALSLQMSILYVTVHHAMRIVWTVTVARLIGDRLNLK
ncbi:hypothetical protein BFP70_00245 [Thioclava sp. SK-1]|uniref:AbrB family transcriptional regulator n=1 Tax=Thioclava sp. SK-1 TaxID=1889770 RepID=UPI0008245A9A|nr:AbrB family transcriptional regulator [Thioclava sp. SK-1]OCX66636.1 hypothetical protein BFP70_00245 [Thioclava sp. SK-1]